MQPKKWKEKLLSKGKSGKHSIILKQHRAAVLLQMGLHRKHWVHIFLHSHSGFWKELIF